DRLLTDWSLVRVRPGEPALRAAGAFALAARRVSENVRACGRRLRAGAAGGSPRGAPRETRAGRPKARRAGTSRPAPRAALAAPADGRSRRRGGDCESTPASG